MDVRSTAAGVVTREVVMSQQKEVLLGDVARSQTSVRRALARYERRMSERDVAVRSARDGGASLGQIAEALGMTRSAVQAVLRRTS